MNTMEENLSCKECGIEAKSVEFLFRHLRKHKMTSKEYALKWVYSGKVPFCECGCGNNTSWNVLLRDFCKFVLGHHAYGRIKTEEEKRKIGKKNSINMKKWLSENPKESKKRVATMLQARTPETEKKRIAATRKAYKEMSSSDKEKFSRHTKILWKKGILVEAQKRAALTFKKRFAEGKYDFTERNNKVSQTIAQRYLEGGFEWSIGEYFSKKMELTCNYRSSWEFEFMNLLDQDERVTSWKFEPLVLKYKIGKKEKRYIPDFLVEFCNQMFLIEVKPLNLSVTEVNTAKSISAKEVCAKNDWIYVLWSKGDDLEKTFSIPAVKM